jgi:hypothetical protein
MNYEAPCKTVLHSPITSSFLRHVLLSMSFSNTLLEKETNFHTLINKQVKKIHNSEIKHCINHSVPRSWMYDIQNPL